VAKPSKVVRDSSKVRSMRPDAAPARLSLDEIHQYLRGIKRRLEHEWGYGWKHDEIGPGGYRLWHLGSATSIIVTVAPHEGTEWIHASIAHPDRDPSYSELSLLHRVAFGNRFAFQVFAPTELHVNIHEHALHLWGRWDGESPLPSFAKYGTI
jgi:hypothetical protein